ncbi:hypothetical protein ACFFX0_15975 [Citricoccus parietis]|uniref:Uncharacterized protein n=1 Tax=Citricoccus parietis TaxID=592307 RepID=A0ABV5G106_9MICC
MQDGLHAAVLRGPARRAGGSWAGAGRSGGRLAGHAGHGGIPTGLAAIPGGRCVRYAPGRHDAG